jgi:ubiquinone/menaquinone biosynthesis C-methylase UbiE
MVLKNSYEWDPQGEKAGPVNEVVDLVKEALIKPKMGDVLDIGCGVGRNSLWLAENGFRVHGIDIDSEQIKEAKKRAKNRELQVDFRVADALNLPFKDKSMSLVIDWGCWHCLPRKEVISGNYPRGVARVLKKNGHFLLFHFSLDDPSVLSGYNIGYGKREVVELLRESFMLKEWRSSCWGQRFKFLPPCLFPKHRGFVYLWQKK